MTHVDVLFDSDYTPAHCDELFKCCLSHISYMMTCVCKKSVSDHTPANNNGLLRYVVYIWLTTTNWWWLVQLCILSLITKHKITCLDLNDLSDYTPAHDDYLYRRELCLRLHISTCWLLIQMRSLSLITNHHMVIAYIHANYVSDYISSHYDDLFGCVICLGFHTTTWWWWWLWMYIMFLITHKYMIMTSLNVWLVSD